MNGRTVFVIGMLLAILLILSYGCSEEVRDVTAKPGPEPVTNGSDYTSANEFDGAKSADNVPTPRTDNRSTTGDSEPVKESPGTLTDKDLGIAGIYLGMTIDDLTTTLGSWTTQDYIQGVGATVLRYPELGLEVYANWQSQQVIGWSISGNSNLRTIRETGLGSTKRDVVAAYGVPSDTSDESRLEYRTTKDRRLRLLFEIQDGKVTEISVRRF